MNLKSQKPAPAINTTMFGIGESQRQNVVNIPIDNLVPYGDQPFKPYSQSRLDELAEDIKTNGVLSPVIVRPADSGYQILAGHNRTAAAKIAGLSEIPCIVKEVDDDTAKLILVTTNLNQRDKLLPSEKAFAYKMQMEAMKKQGKRTDLTLSQIETKSDLDSSLTLSQFETKLDSGSEIANNGADSRANIFRYIRLTYLTPYLLNLADDDILPLNCGVNLSYLQPSEQGLLAVLMTGGEIKKIDLKSSAQLKELSTQNNFSKETVLAVFAPKQKQTESKKITFAALADYFDADIAEEQALEYIRKALEYYRGNG